MESDRNSKNKKGPAARRNGARTARPRLADLLESVTVSDESPGTDTNKFELKPDDTLTALSSKALVPPDLGPVRSTSGRPKIDLDPLDDIPDNRRSSSAIAARKRRESLYSRRGEESGIERDTRVEPFESSRFDLTNSDGRNFDTNRFELTSSDTSHFDTSRSDASRSDASHSNASHSDMNYSGSNQPESSSRGFGSLADRIFGDRKETTDGSTNLDRFSSSGDTSNSRSARPSFSGSSSPDAAGLDSSLLGSNSSSTSNNDDDWTAKFSADAPLPSSLDSSAAPDKRTLGAERRASIYGSTPPNSPPNPASNPTSNLAPNPAYNLPPNQPPNLAPNRGNAPSRRNPLLRNHSAPPRQPMPPPPSISALPPAPAQRPVPRRYSTAPASANESQNSVSIKGRSDGVWIELGQGIWSDVMEILSQRLIQSTGFFRGGEVTVDVGGRPLRQNELFEICKLTEAHGLMVTAVRSRSEQSCQVALAAGLAASLDAPEGLLAQAASSNYEKLEHFVYRGNLRSGQILRRAETILVMGDVNPGSRIVSDSDILVWGRLRGIAHAGAAGDTNAVIAALLMEPTQIRISNSVAILPEHEVKTSFADKFAGNTSPNGTRRPEIAHSIGEDIIVDMWDESKPGGIMAFRRALPN